MAYFLAKNEAFSQTISQLTISSSSVESHHPKEARSSELSYRTALSSQSSRTSSGTFQSARSSITNRSSYEVFIEFARSSGADYKSARASASSMHTSEGNALMGGVTTGAVEAR